MGVVRVLSPPKRCACESSCRSTMPQPVLEQAWVEVQLVAEVQISAALGEMPASTVLHLGHRAVEACPL